MTLGKLLTNRGRFDDAEFLYRRALEVLDPDSREAGALTMALGDLLTDRGSLEDAEYLYRRTLDRAHSGNPAVRYLATRLGELLTRRGRLREAEFIYRRVLETLDPGGADAKDIGRRLIELLSGRGMTGEVERLQRRSSVGYPRVLHLSVEGTQMEGIAASLDDWLASGQAFSPSSVDRGWRYIGRTGRGGSAAVQVLVDTRLSLMHLITTIAQWRDSSPLHPSITITAAHSDVPSIRIASSEPEEVIDAMIHFM
jgi:hypothetical protein